MKKIILAGAIILFLPGIALGAYVGAGENISAPGSQNGTEPIAQNVYLAGGTVNVSNPVHGDLLAAGGTTIISGKVDEDILAVGGTVSMLGGGAQDVRIAGGNVTIGGKIDGEVMVAGGQVSVMPETTITKDSYLVGGTLVFAGVESGNLTVSGREIRIDGMVNGNLTIPRAEKVTFGPKAVVKGSVEYSAPQEATIENGAQISASPVFHKIESPTKEKRAAFFGFVKTMFFLKLIAILAAAYLLWYTRRRDVSAVIENVYKHFWGALLRGFAILILVPIAGIILLFTVVGWIPAGAMLATYVALLLLVSPLAAIVATSFIMTLFKKGHSDLPWYAILGGVIVLSLISFIPFVGWLVRFVIYLVALGATVSVLKAKFSA